MHHQTITWHCSTLSQLWVRFMFVCTFLAKNLRSGVIFSAINHLYNLGCGLLITSKSIGVSRFYCFSEARVLSIILWKLLLYSEKILRTINFAVFEEFTTALKINFLKLVIESYDSLVDPWNLIHEVYRGEITLKIFALKITCYTVLHIENYYTIQVCFIL